MSEETTAPEGAANPDADATGGSETRTFTQDEVNKLVGATREKVRAQYKGHDELKAKAEKLEALEDEKRSEAEKLLAALDKANKSAQEAQERERAATERAQSTLIRAAVVSEASRQRAIDPDAVYRLLDTSKLTLGDGDQVDGVTDAVQALLEERSYLAGSRPSGGFDGGARDTAPAENSVASFNAQLRKEAGFA